MSRMIHYYVYRLKEHLLFEDCKRLTAVGVFEKNNELKVHFYDSKKETVFTRKVFESKNGGLYIKVKDHKFSPEHFNNVIRFTDYVKD